MSSKTLSKSKYTSFCQCAKQLWLNAYHPDLATVYPKIQYMTPVDQARTRKALLEYCKLDTYAMVKVFWKLVEVSK